METENNQDKRTTSNGKQLRTKESVKIMESTIKKLENNLKESNNVDKQMLANICADKMKTQGLSYQLEEAKKENKQLLNILQQRCGENELSKRSSQMDLSSCSTMSMVNLQYKYEELLASHNGLLKILDMRISEIQKIQDENANFKKEIDAATTKLTIYEKKLESYIDKIKRIKERKNKKIKRLETESETLKIVHNQLVDLLHKQCMEKDLILEENMKSCNRSDRALLLQEVRKNNLLCYENFKLVQEVQYLRALANLSPSSSRSSSKHSIVSASTRLPS